MSLKLTKRAKDRTGERYGRLVVKEAIGRNKHSQIIWRCVCDCGNIKDVQSGGLGHRTNSCGCLRLDCNKDSTLPSHAKASKSPYWKGCGEISGYKLNKIKSGAKKRNFCYELEKHFLWDLFLEQDRKCALSNISIEFGKKGRELGTASLDRIDSSKGYVVGNVQWVHKDVNFMKQDFDQDYFLDLCRHVCNNNGVQTINKEVEEWKE